MPKKIEVLSREVRLTGFRDQDYICLTDIARFKNEAASDDLIRNWLRNRNTIEFLGIWEQINNPGLNPSNSTGLENRQDSTVSPSLRTPYPSQPDRHSADEFANNRESSVKTARTRRAEMITAYHQQKKIYKLSLYGVNKLNECLLEIGTGLVAETRELSEDVYLDLDGAGSVVSITLEHASKRSDLSEVSFLCMNQRPVGVG